MAVAGAQLVPAPDTVNISAPVIPRVRTGGPGQESDGHRTADHKHDRNTGTRHGPASGHGLR